MDQTRRTVSDAARALAVPERTIQYWLKTGVLRGENVAGRVWQIPADEIARVQQEGRPKRGRPPRAQAPS